MDRFACEPLLYVAAGKDRISPATYALCTEFSVTSHSCQAFGLKDVSFADSRPRVLVYYSRREKNTTIVDPIVRSFDDPGERFEFPAC